jgi:hypothetical protein
VRRSAGFVRDARSHCTIMATRITTYATTTIVKSGSCASKTGAMPAAITSTPAICTIVTTRYSQSSTSNDVANQVKFIHAHQIAKKIIR